MLDEGSEPWMGFFSVHNEAPVSDPRRKGKRRRKLDMRIDSALRRPRTRFAFEAKRLGNRHGVREYVVGMEPANCWVEGRAKERERGTLQFLKPGETRKYHLELGVLDGREAIGRFRELVDSLRN